MQLFQSSGGVDLDDLLEQEFEDLLKVARGALQALQLNRFGVGNSTLVDSPLNGGLKRAEGLLSGFQDLSLVDLEYFGRDLVRSFWSVTISFVLLLSEDPVVLVYTIPVKEKQELVFGLVKPALDFQPPLGDY